MFPGSSWSDYWDEQYLLRKQLNGPCCSPFPVPHERCRFPGLCVFREMRDAWAVSRPRDQVRGRIGPWWTSGDSSSCYQPNKSKIKWNYINCVLWVKCFLLLSKHLFASRLRASTDFCWIICKGRGVLYLLHFLELKKFENNLGP